MNLEQRQSPLWWTRNLSSTVYFLRELTGVLIAAWTIYFLTAAIFDPTVSFFTETTFRIASAVGLTAAIFHTITWFWVTVKISPLPLSKKLSLAAFLGLIAAWFVISYALLNFFYV
jgi:fumarate reductase subunit C